MDEKTYGYMKERIERYEKLKEEIIKLNKILERVHKYPNSIHGVIIQGNSYYIPKDFEKVLVEYVHKKIEELDNMMEEI